MTLSRSINRAAAGGAGIIAGDRPARGTGSGGGVAAPTATATMAQINTNDTKRIYQRSTTSGGSQGKGTGVIPITLSSALAGTINARVRSSDGVTILEPEFLAGTIANAATTINVTVPARLGWFFVDIRTAAGWQNGTTLVGMGALFGFAGQSLMVFMLGRGTGQTETYASLGVTPNPNMSVLATFADSGSYSPTVATMPWSLPGDVTDWTGPNSVGVGEFLNQMIAATGVNCGVIGSAQGGQRASYWYTGAAGWTQLSSVLARAGGAFEGFFWGQGHTDAQFGCPDTAYYDALTQVFSQVDAANSFAGYGKYVWTIPQTNATFSPRASNKIRAAAEAWCQANSAVHVQAGNFPMYDGIHETQPGARILGQNMYRATRSRYGLSSGMGPRVLSATRSGTTITVTLSDVGQTNLVLAGTPGNRIFVFPQGYRNSIGTPANNRFPVSSVSVVNKTTLAVTLANDPGDGHVLDLFFYWPTDGATPQSDNIYDNVTAADGISNGRLVQFNTAPVTVAAPVPRSTVNAPPGGFVTVPSIMVMTGTGDTYAAGPSGFGQQMTDGSGKTASFGSSWAPFTIEFYLVGPPLPAANKVFTSFNSSQWLGISAAGLLLWNGSSTGFTLTPGNRYHIAWCGDANGSRVYVTDITGAGSGNRVFNNATPVTTKAQNEVITARAFSSAGFEVSGGAMDELAFWTTAKYTGTTYTAPGPLAGTEANLAYLYKFENNLAETVGY